MNPLARYPWGIGLEVAGGLLVVGYFVKEGMAMEGQHWIMLAVFLVVGYVLGRIWTTPAQMIGLP